jgi:hypothetical protein
MWDGVRMICFGRVLGVMVGMIGMAGPTGRAVADDPAEHYGIPQVKYIKEQVAKGWDESRLLPSPAATDGEIEAQMRGLIDRAEVVAVCRKTHAYPRASGRAMTGGCSMRPSQRQ